MILELSNNTSFPKIERFGFIGRERLKKAEPKDKEYICFSEATFLVSWGQIDRIVITDWLTSSYFRSLIVRIKTEGHLLSS